MERDKDGERTYYILTVGLASADQIIIDIFQIEFFY
jgi:hypothetical protein